ncbi:MAG TPA: DUF2946 family protein [Ottowia sp.]|uniref:DUF2946 family protein n=1 Tax=Ottowia sp. TaxID=1898956 RepID=UPI002BFD3D84|nr:DUF2946 family protein [Ottowia sp.]HOB66313.1 DUF2946 family protein [Ottowia sp.]
MHPLRAPCHARPGWRWLALLVLLLATLAPTVSRTLAAAGGGGWAQVCTPEGVRWVALSDADARESGVADSQTPASPSLDHCPLCVLMGDRLAPPSPPWVWAEAGAAPGTLIPADDPARVERRGRLPLPRGPPQSLSEPGAERA